MYQFDIKSLKKYLNLQQNRVKLYGFYSNLLSFLHSLVPTDEKSIVVPVNRDRMNKRSDEDASVVTLVKALIPVKIHESQCYHRHNCHKNIREKLAISLSSINPIVKVIHIFCVEGILLLVAVVDNVRTNHKRHRENLSLTVYYYSILHTSRVVN